MAEGTYRPIAADEEDAFARTDALAFASGLEQSRRWVKERPIGDLRGWFAGGRLVSQLVLNPFQCHTGRGTTIAVGGLGGVATPVEHRRQRYVAELLRATCGEMRERGMSVSLLNPFKASFYGQFGWASSLEACTYRGPTASLTPLHRQRAGQWEQVDEAAIPELDRIYTAALGSRFGPVVRSESYWRSTKFDASSSVPVAYLWRDADGAARSYAILSLHSRGDANEVVVREAVALDPLARTQIFALLGNHDAQVRDLVLPTPPDAPINALLPDPLRRELKIHYMARLIDIPAALNALASPPSGAGRITIAITDDWLPDQAGTYALEYDAGAVACQRTSAPADLSCDVRVLAQIATRFLRPRQAATFGALTAHNRAALLTAETLFAGLAPYCPEWF